MNNDFSLSDLINATKGMFKPKKRKKISGKSLSSISDHELASSIIYHVIDNVVGRDWANEFKLVCNLPIGFIHIYSIFKLDSQVNNGGFHQFFTNESRLFAESAHLAYMGVGAIKASEIIRNVIVEAAKENDLRTAVNNTGTVESFVKSYDQTKLSSFDKLYYECIDDLDQLQIIYIRNNYSHFT